MSGKFHLNKKNTFIANKMLEDVTSIFDEYNIKYVLTAGTLLGIVREGRLLPWDKDVDLRVFRQDVERLFSVVPKIKKAGYMVRFRYQSRDDFPLKLNEVRILKIYSKKYFLFKGEVMMDCFIATRHRDQYVWSCGGLKRYTKKAVPVKYYDSLDTLHFNGKDYFIPSDKYEYLELRYGDWKTPMKKWNYSKDDGAIIPSIAPDPKDE